MATFFNSYRIEPGAEFEIYKQYSLALSALLLLKRWAQPADRVVLVTDTPDHFERHGFTSLYDDVIVPKHDDGCSNDLFFALTKLRGLRDIPAPVYSIDWDLFVLHQSIIDQMRIPPAVGLHYDCLCNRAYDPGLFARWLQPEFDLTIRPINCGIVGFADDVSKNKYCDLAFDFMRRYSEAPDDSIEPSHAQMFAEQSILGHLGADVLYDSGTSGYFEDLRCYHLWGNKIWFDKFPDEKRNQAAWTEAKMRHLGFTVPEFLPPVV